MEVEWSRYFWDRPYGYESSTKYYDPSLRGILSPKCGRRRECPTCAHQWMDAHGKDECPKCLSKLAEPIAMKLAGGWKRSPGEVSTFKQPPSSAMESQYGSCIHGGLHYWRFGICKKCGASEGDELTLCHHSIKLGLDPQYMSNRSKAARAIRKNTTPERIAWPAHRLAEVEASQRRKTCRPSSAHSSAANDASPKVINQSRRPASRDTMKGMSSTKYSGNSVESAPCRVSSLQVPSRQASSPSTNVPISNFALMSVTHPVRKMKLHSKPANTDEMASLSQRMMRVSEFLGIDTDLPAVLAIEKANKILGIAQSASPLPAQVDKAVETCFGILDSQK